MLHLELELKFPIRFMDTHRYRLRTHAHLLESQTLGIGQLLVLVTPNQKQRHQSIQLRGPDFFCSITSAIIVLAECATALPSGVPDLFLTGLQLLAEVALYNYSMGPHHWSPFTECYTVLKLNDVRLSTRNTTYLIQI